MTIFEVPANAVEPLQVVWLILIAVLWIGFFFLEGFDFGVGMLVPFLGKDDRERRVMYNTVGPHWDGNEVWLLTAGGAIFAAFSGWYATLFSGLYLPLFLVLVGLILRGVAFEYRGKQPSLQWRRGWDWAAAIGSFLPALVFGVGFANFVKGLPVAETAVAYRDTPVPLFSGTFWGLFSPFALLGGLLFVALFITHGAIFLSLKTRGAVHDKAKALANKGGLVAIVLLAGFVVWANAGYGNLPGQLSWLLAVAWIVGVVAVVALGFGWFMNSKGRDGFAFLGTALSVVTLTVMIFCHLYPGLGFDNTLAPNSPLDITTAASSPATLKLMTIAAACLVPVVLAYQVWTYVVFRRRLSTKNIVDDTVTVGARAV